MTVSQPGSQSGSLWPADVIHVNEDGWVLINRGSQHGVAVGLHLLVVGTGARELHDLFAPNASAEPEAQPPLLRIRRTYELLEVVYVEESCAIAIATRTPTGRRPTVYRGPEGELLVWVPLPEGYSWPPPGGSSTVESSEQAENPTTPWGGDSGDRGDADADDAADETDTPVEPDTPPERAPQDDEPWEEALPLNSVSVGDIVLPAIPAVPTSLSSSTTAPDAAPASEPASPFEQGRTYDWLKKPGE